MAYDLIVSTYPPDEFLPARDRIPGRRGCYGSATRHIAQLLEDNPLARLVLWTGAESDDIWLPPGLSGRVSIILRGGSAPRIVYYNRDYNGQDRLRDTLAEALSEFCLSLNDQGQIVVKTICRRGLVEMRTQDPTYSRPVRPCLAKSISCWVPDLNQFLQLVNQDNVTAQELAVFLEKYPDFVIGNKLLPRRWMVSLRSGGPDRSEPSEDIWLEPAWVPQRWHIPDLEAPDISRPPASGSERQWSCQLLATALAQMRAKHEAFNRPQFQRQLADVGLAGFSPHLALVLSHREAPALPHTPPESIGTYRTMTFANLNKLVRKEAGWLASSPALNYRRGDRYAESRDLPIQSISNVPPAGPSWVKLARRLTVLNRYGICATPAALIVKTVQKYCPHHLTRITCNGVSVSGGSIMSLLTLEANHGKQLLVEVQGPRAAELLEKLTQLFNKGFYYEEQMLPVPAAHHEYVPEFDPRSPAPDG